MSQVNLCHACSEPLDDNVALSCTTQKGAVVNYIRCHACGLYVMHPFPSNDEIASFYDDSYYGLGETKFVGVVERLREHFASGRARAMARCQPKQDPKILDVGCGSGTFLMGMAQRGFDIYGVELAGPAYERASGIPGIHLHKGELVPEVFADVRFDVITIWHVLEHVADPMALLQQCHSLLAEDGSLHIEVPNAGSFQAKRCGAQWLHLDPPRHLYQFTKDSLQGLLQRAGFEVESVSYRSMEMGVIGLLQSWLNFVIKPRDLFYDMLRTRNRCPGTAAAKSLSVLLAAVFMVPAALLAIAEMLAGSGAVLSVTCKKSSR